MARAIAPRAGPIAVPHHVLWFLTLWHLVTVWIWAWDGAGRETAMRHGGEGDGLAAWGAAYGAGLEIRLASEVEGDLVDRWMGREDGKTPGGQGGEVQ